jgi:peptide/nickel transport system permease protein
VLRRILGAIPLVIGITLFTFILLQLVPGDPALTLAGPRATEERVEAIRAELGLDRSLPAQYVAYLGNLVQGNFGQSIRSKEPVTSIIRERTPVTVWLLGAALILSVSIALPLGAFAARHRGGWIDHAIRVVSTFFLTMPPFWVGLMLLLVFALGAGWFPVGGFGETTAERLRAIALPAFTLALWIFPIQLQSFRSSMIDVDGSDYLQAGRSIGLEGLTLFRRYILRNATAAMVTLLAVQMGFMLFGAVIVETTFNLSGLGDAMVRAVSGRDFAVVQGITIVFAVAVIAINLLADVIVAALDPRVEIR